jgi:hypothetical protein
MNITIRLTRKEARELGLLVCGNCGYPENNHFSWGKKPCAHDPKCKEYKEVARRGKIVNPRSSKSKRR